MDKLSPEQREMIVKALRHRAFNHPVGESHDWGIPYHVLANEIENGVYG